MRTGNGVALRSASLEAMAVNSKGQWAVSESVFDAV